MTWKAFTRQHMARRVTSLGEIDGKLADPTKMSAMASEKGCSHVAHELQITSRDRSRQTPGNQREALHL